jgi:hypothetical protein
MEPLHKVTKFGINTSSHQINKEVMSVSNLFGGSERTAQQILIKFHWQVFEQMRKRFISPDTTSNDLSSDALRVEFSKIDDQALVKKQRDATDELEYAGLYSNIRRQCKYKFFKMPFQISDKSLFMSGSQLSYFDLNRNTTSSLTRENWDDVLHKAYAEEGTLELCKTSFSTLTPGKDPHSSIINLSFKW